MPLSLFLLCDLGQVAESLWTIVSSPVKIRIIIHTPISQLCGEGFGVKRETWPGVISPLTLEAGDEVNGLLGGLA